MRVLLFFMLITMGLTIQPPQHAIVFTSEGNYYRLDLTDQRVQWYRSLGVDLLAFQTSGQFQGRQGSYMLPTIDGHFLYIDSHSEIVIQRDEVEQLLKVCLEGPQARQGITPPQYFLYDKWDYYIINLLTGQARELESALKGGIPRQLTDLSVLKIKRKLLKQLRPDLTVAWSTISSELDLVTAEAFILDPKSSSSTRPDPESLEIRFRRVRSGGVEVIAGESSFEMGGKGHIFAVFSYEQSKKAFFRHGLEFATEEPRLALEYKPLHRGEKGKSIDVYRESDQSGISQVLDLPHSAEISRNKQQKKSIHEMSDIEYCINTYRTLRSITDQSSKTAPIHFHSRSHINQSLTEQTQNLEYLDYCPPNVISEPTKEQPYVWMTLIISVFVLVIGGSYLYKTRINSLLQELNQVQVQTGQQIQQFQQRLGKFEQLQKMYEVDWDRIAYRVAGHEWYEHVVFEGRFLNQDAHVFAVRLEGSDVVSLESKLNLLLKFSHKGLAKLYYYTRNSEFLLIFTQKMTPLAHKDLKTIFEGETVALKKKGLISEVTEAVAYLDSRIQVSSIPLEALEIDTSQQGEGERQFAYKLNAVPCLLRTVEENSEVESVSSNGEGSSAELRMSLVSISHLILHKGETFDRKKVEKMLNQQEPDQEQYLQFYSFLLYECHSRPPLAGEKDQPSPASETGRQWMFRQILEHPFLWDSKRKILFLSDFSNYIETHIDDTKVKKLDAHAKDCKVITVPWIRQFHMLFVKEVSSHRKYDYQSVRDLIRVIRNKLNHFHEIPKEVRAHVGRTPEAFIEYCLGLFPKLLHFAYVYTRKKKWKLHMK